MQDAVDDIEVDAVAREGLLIISKWMQWLKKGVRLILSSMMVTLLNENADDEVEGDDYASRYFWIRKLMVKNDAQNNVWLFMLCNANEVRYNIVQKK